MESRSERLEEAKDVRAIFERMHPGWTDEDLLNRPSECEHFCNVVRTKLKKEILDSRITGYLMNGRKKGGHAYGKPRSRIRLATELEAAGSALDPKDFSDRIADLFHCLFRNATDEGMLRRPSESKAFVEAVRRNLGLPHLPERLICQTLTNLRKAGYQPMAN